MEINEITGLVLTHLGAVTLGFAFGHFCGWLSEYKRKEEEVENES